MTSKNFDQIHELNLFMRNYNIASEVAERHFANPSYPVELKKRDLDDLFSRAVSITNRLLGLAKRFELKIDKNVWYAIFGTVNVWKKGNLPHK